MPIYNIPRINRMSGYAKPIMTYKKPDEYKYLIGKKLKDIILFEDSKEEEDYTDKIVLPRHYHLFIGTLEGEIQFKPYEYDEYRIVVSVWNNIIFAIESIGQKLDTIFNILLGIDVTHIPLSTNVHVPEYIVILSACAQKVIDPDVRLCTSVLTPSQS